jgi:hypothetical protein
MVEAAGIEPASEKVRTRASTRLADSVFYLTFVPLSGKWVEGQPVHFASRLRTSPGAIPNYRRLVKSSGEDNLGDVAA